MKNIHVLPTDKPNRLFENVDGGLSLNDELEPNGIMCQNLNIYITSDEEIRKGDFVTNGKYVSQAINEWWTKFYIGNPELKADYWKIILTTDQDLIKDGVQAIDDEFLEWFIKNPSCEEVEIVKGFADGTNYGYNFLDYKIIIPKEEPTYIIGIDPYDKPKQETLEEAARNYKDLKLPDDLYDGFIAGAKWQPEQDKNLYSEEEVYNILEQAMKDCYSLELEAHYSGDYKNLKQYFEQFKKK